MTEKKQHPPSAHQQKAAAQAEAISGMDANDEEVRTLPVRPLREDLTKADSGRDDDPPSRSGDREALVGGLNRDLAGEYQAILMYTHYSAKLTGPYREGLRARFQAEIAEAQGHAQFLADKIAALGGEPTTEPRAVPHANRPREMLMHALRAEKQAIADYDERIRQAEAFGDIGLKVGLENQIAGATRHKEEIERILAGWGDY